MYIRNLAEKGILRIGDLIYDNTELIVKSNYKLRELNILLLDIYSTYFCNRCLTR